ncbi:MAG: RDD family protein [Pseudomonadota bacterium]
MNWFYRTNAGDIGPVSGEEMVRLIEAGEVTETTPVRRDGSDQWIEAWQTDRASYLGMMGSPEAELDGGTAVASAWARIAAYIVDYLGVLFATFLVSFVVELVVDMPREFDALSDYAPALILGVGVVFLFYGLPASSPRQATLGMQALGIRMIRPNGQRIGLIRGGIRPLVASLSTGFLFLGVLVALFNRERITLHDWACGTRVVKGG